MMCWSLANMFRDERLTENITFSNGCFRESCQKLCVCLIFNFIDYVEKRNCAAKFQERFRKHLSRQCDTCETWNVRSIEWYCVSHKSLNCSCSWNILIWVHKYLKKVFKKFPLQLLAIFHFHAKLWTYTHFL